MNLASKAVMRNAAALALGMASPALAVDVVYEPSPYNNNGVLEAQGFNGRIDLPTTVSLLPSGSYASVLPMASAGNGTDVYTLAGDGWTLITSDAQTGAYIGQVNLCSELNDIAYNIPPLRRGVSL